MFFIFQQFSIPFLLMWTSTPPLLPFLREWLLSQIKQFTWPIWWANTSGSAKGQRWVDQERSQLKKLFSHLFTLSWACNTGQIQGSHVFPAGCSGRQFTHTCFRTGRQKHAFCAANSGAAPAHATFSAVIPALTHSASTCAHDLLSLLSGGDHINVHVKTK